MLARARVAASASSLRASVVAAAAAAAGVPRVLTRGNAARASDPMTYRTSTGRVNTILRIVPQQEAWVVERLGKYSRTLGPGLRVLIPFIDRVRYAHSLKEVAMAIHSQTAVTQDNVRLEIDGVLYMRIVDPVRASYGVEDPNYAVLQLAMTTMRAELGKMTLDRTFQERAALNTAIVSALNAATEAWGIECLRYEIRDITPPPHVVRAMEMQVTAERNKRAEILESEGKKIAAINVAEGHKQATVLQSEAVKLQAINTAHGEAQAILERAKRTAEALDVVGRSLSSNEGVLAAQLRVAEQYVSAYGNIAKQTNTVIMPGNPSDVREMVAQAFAVVQQLGGSSSSTASSSSSARAAELTGSPSGKTKDAKLVASAGAPAPASAPAASSGVASGKPRSDDDVVLIKPDRK